MSGRLGLHRALGGQAPPLRTADLRALLQPQTSYRASAMAAEGHAHLPARALALLDFWSAPNCRVSTQMVCVEPAEPSAGWVTCSAPGTTCRTRPASGSAPRQPSTRCPGWGQPACCAATHLQADCRLQTQEVRSKFAGDLQEAEAGRLASWQSGYSALALVILLDQLTRRAGALLAPVPAQGLRLERSKACRNIHRGTAHMYHNDEAAKRLALSLWVRAAVPAALGSSRGPCVRADTLLRVPARVSCEGISAGQRERV